MRSARRSWLFLAGSVLIFSVAAAGFVLISSVAAAQMVPVAVSPGGTEDRTLIAEVYPTFNWGAVEGATGFTIARGSPQWLSQAPLAVHAASAARL